ncbi:MAG: translesion error-prone DNA polymerase V autoproteolytic subunit [Caulobacter sp.]|nr:translesion error-prone DNA polymerase V autoproteolytic subunit [Caulobacter sp.]
MFSPSPPAPCRQVSEVSMRPVVVGLPLPLPLVGFRICCGFPSPADDWIEDAIDVSRLVVTNPAATFLWRASGDCMTPTILDGDYLVCDRSLAPVSGDVVVAVVDGEPTVKRLTYVAGHPALSHDNPRALPFAPDAASEISIWGVVAWSLRAHRPTR